MSTDVNLKDTNELKALSKFINNIFFKNINDSSHYILIAKQYLLSNGQYTGKRKKDKRLVLGNKGIKENLYYNMTKIYTFGGFWSYCNKDEFY